MKVKVLAILITLTLCVSLAGVLAPPFSAPVQANPGELHVGPLQPYSTIQAAIDHANPGDTIIVHDNSGIPYTYLENIVVNIPQLTLEAEGEVTLQAADDTKAVVEVDADGDNMTLSGFTATGGSTGIYLGGSNSTIKNNIIEYNGYGIEVNSEHNLIINNNITDNRHGIWIEGDNNKILGNNIFNNGAADSGIHLTADAAGNEIEFNNIVGNGLYGVCNNNTAEYADANNNWWGNATGPYDPVDNPEGTGDAVSDYVDYWWSLLGAPLVLPIHYEVLVGAGPHVVDAITEADTTVNLTIAEGIDSLDIVVARYESQPFPDDTFPDLSLGKFIDIGFPGGSYPEEEIVWPIHAEMTYTNEELSATSISETTLGFYYLRYQYYDATYVESYARHWAHTGVDIANNTIWADLVSDDFNGGAPFGTGGLSQPRIFAPDIYVSDANGNDTWDGQSPAWNGTSGPKKTIQGGIDAVAVGGTVHVENGTYSVTGPYAAYVDNPNLTIYSSDGPGAAIVSGPGDNFGFWADDSGVTIDGFNITGFDYGIYLSDFAWGADNCTVKDCSATSNGVSGIYLNTRNCHIFSSDLTNNSGDGIYLDSDAEGNTIEDCNATSNEGSGIFLSASNCNIFSSNLTNNSFGIFLFGADGNTIMDCNATGNGLSNGGGGIWLHNSYDNTIDGCNANNNTYGIHLDSSNDNTIDGCNVYNNTYGIHLDSSQSNSITNSTVSQNTVHGILLDSSQDNQIRGNNILSNPGSSNPPSPSGIHLTGSSYDNIIRFNNIVGNSPDSSASYGIYSDNANHHVTADNNWWGSDTGPYDPIYNENGTGDAVSDHVYYSPWLGAPLVLPAVHHETLDAGAYTVNASAEAGTTVGLTVSAGDETDIDIARYESQPFPGASFPDTALGIYIDILVSNPDAVNWPIQVNVTYTDAQVTAAGIDETTLGLYYYNATANAFVRCSDTGVDTANNIIWANVTQEEAGYLTGTPFAAGGQPAAPPPPPPSPPISAVPTISQWGMIAMAILFVGALAGTVRRRLAVAMVRHK